MAYSSVFLALISGTLLVLSLPKPDWYPLAWIAFLPLMFALARATSIRAAALYSYVAGFAFFSGTFYWMTQTMIVYGGLDAASAFGVGLLFSIVYSMYFLGFGLALYIFIRRVGPRGLFLAAPIWVAIELIRTHFFFNGYPWMLTGYALVPYEGILQITAWTGVFGLSFIATGVNSALAYAVLLRDKRWMAGSLALIAVFWALPILGESPSGDPIDVRIVQTNIPLDQPWQKPAGDQLLDELEEISGKPSPKPKLVVWPETPAPFHLKEDTEFRERIARIARRAGAYVLLGYIDSINESPSNSAGLVDPHGNIVSRYDKIRLVPFGEYVPLKDLLFFAEKFTQQVGDFAPGSDYTLGEIDGHRFNTAICYESIFPNFVRQFVKQGSELIVVITNDGWFGESSAPFQHLRMGVVRAVENRRYIVRSANTGISAIIDPYGRILSQTSMGIRTVLEGTARFRSDQTFYTTYGDLFAYMNVAAVVVAGLLCLYGRRGLQPRVFSKSRRTHVRRTH